MRRQLLMLRIDGSARLLRRAHSTAMAPAATACSAAAAEVTVSGGAQVTGSDRSFTLCASLSGPAPESWASGCTTAGIGETELLAAHSTGLELDAESRAVGDASRADMIS